jgi:hypothetical protein
MRHTPGFTGFDAISYRAFVVHFSVIVASLRRRTEASVRDVTTGRGPDKEFVEIFNAPHVSATSSPSASRSDASLQRGLTQRPCRPKTTVVRCFARGQERPDRGGRARGHDDCPFHTSRNM